MPVVNIAFSGGTESTALMVYALQKGFEVNLCVLNVSNSMETFLFELANARKVAEAVKGLNYPGNIHDVIALSTPRWAPAMGMSCDLCVNGVTQQFSVALAMMDIRRYHLARCNPTTFIGWIKGDASENSFNEYDHSSKDYTDLLNVPVMLGKISNADRTQVPFRAPFWNMTKKEVFELIPEALLKFVIHTGKGITSFSEGVVTYTSYPDKKKEWKASGIEKEMQTSWSYPLSEISLEDRVFTGQIIASDLGLPDKYNDLVSHLAAGESRKYQILGSPSKRHSYVRELKKLLLPLYEDCEKEQQLSSPE